jgi:hypothetical protein
VNDRPVVNEEPRAAIFARGLALGALVGAAIAGSAIWGRRRARPGEVLEPRAGDAAGETGEVTSTAEPAGEPTTTGELSEPG